MINFATGVGTDPFRYIYVLNYTDQTVSCIDTNSDTVTATITLTASKSLRNIVYRLKSKSIYVLTNNWFDRIDADPSSGTFNTVVDSGSLTSNSALNYVEYIPYLDCLGYIGFGSSSRGLIPFLSDDKVSNLTTGGADAIFRLHFPSFFVDNLLINQPAPSVSVPIVMTQNYIIAPSQTAFSLFEHTPISGEQFYLKDVTPRSDFSGLSYPVIIGNYITGQRTTTFYFLHKKTGAVIETSLTVSPNDRIAHKYALGRIFIYRRINTNINISVIDWPSLTDLGDISRTSYKATDENCTRQVLYSPFSKKFYVLGGNTAGTGTVNKVHVYDPTASLGSMYQTSITVGNSATYPSDYFETAMAMNGVEDFEFEDVSRR